MLLALFLTACAPPAPPVTDRDPAPPPPGPGWLPAGWVEDATPATSPLDGAITRTYHPPHAAAPVLLVSRLSPEQAEGLRQQAKGDLLPWVAHEVWRSIQRRRATVTGPVSWTREGLTAGLRYDVEQLWEEAPGLRLDGSVGIGETREGGVVILSAFIERGGDRNLVEQLLKAAPLTATE